MDAGSDRITRTAEALKDLAEVLMPCHCTGVKAVNHFLEVFKDRCQPLRVGDVVEL